MAAARSGIPPAVADDRRYDLEELIVRPGTYFNPQTEVLVTVDDSSSLDTEIFNLEEFEGADWVHVSDELPVDEAKRDELLEDFQATWRSGEAGPPRAAETENDAAPDPVIEGADAAPEPDDGDPAP